VTRGMPAALPSGTQPPPGLNLDDGKPCLDDRWNEGCTNAWKVWEEIVPPDHRRDRDAVTAGLTLPWNPGAAEGHVNRIRMLKRRTFGRVGVVLSRKRVLLAS